MNKTMPFKSCQQDKSEGFDSCDQPGNLTQIEFKSLTFRCVWPSNLMDDLEEQYPPLLCHVNCVHYFTVISEFKLEFKSGNGQIGSKSAIFFVPCDLEIWQITLKNNRAPLLCYFKLCASFHNHCPFARGIYRWPVDSPHKGTVRRKMREITNALSYVFKIIYSFASSVHLITLLFFHVIAFHPLERFW